MIELENKPIKYQKIFEQGVFEIEISSSTTEEDFVKIEETFNSLYGKLCRSRNIILEKIRKKEERAKKIMMKKNPCYYCYNYSSCKNENKGKKSCSDYIETPF